MFTPLPFAPGSYQPVVGTNYITFIGTGATPYTFQWGVWNNVITDGSLSIPITFPIPFPNTVIAVLPGIATTSGVFSGYSLSAETNNLLPTGFNIVVSGGAPTYFVNLSWLAIGY